MGLGLGLGLGSDPTPKPKPKPNQVREGRIAASDTAELFRESTPHLRRALKKVYAHDGSEKLCAAWLGLGLGC